MKMRERLIKVIDEEGIMTEEQQRLVINYAEGKIAPVANKLSFFKITKCDRIRKQLKQDEDEASRPLFHGLRNKQLCQ